MCYFGRDFAEMSVVVNEELVEQLKDVGSKLLQPPSSTPELVNLLDVSIYYLSLYHSQCVFYMIQCIIY